MAPEASTAEQINDRRMAMRAVGAGAVLPLCAAVSVKVYFTMVERMIEPSEVGRERIAAALADIRERTQADVVDLSERDFVREDFIDFAHLSFDTGAPKFSRMLADEIAVRLGERAPLTPKAARQ